MNLTKEELEQFKLQEDFKTVFGTPEGKRFFWYLLVRCHFINSTFTGNSKTYLLEGERNVALHLIELAGRASPGLLAEIMTLGLNERELERALAEAREQKEKEDDRRTEWPN